MKNLLERLMTKIPATKLGSRYYRFRSSIYGRVVFIIAGSIISLFILFNIAFRSIYFDFFNKSVSQTGDNVSSIVEGALYHSMLQNDKAMLQQTLEVISTMSGIDEVNMYNDTDSLSFTSLSTTDLIASDPNCIDCHDDLGSMFHPTEKAYKIFADNPECGISLHNCGERHLLIRKPILNERSCYTADCHWHDESDEVLGSLIINLPLDNLDSFMTKSSRELVLLAALITILLVTFLILFTRKRIKDPLNAIIVASEAVSKGDNSIRIDITPDLLEDIRSVSLAFNNMLDNIDNASRELQNWSQQLEYKVQRKSEELSQAQNELIHVERIASLGKLSSSVAHEINNPLSGILIYTKLINKQLDRPEFFHPRKESILKNLKFIETETKRCGDIVKGLLDFSRKEQEDFEPASLHKLLTATYQLMTHSIKIADISFIRDYGAVQDQIFCSPNQVKQACMALIVNSSEAIGEQGEIILRTSNPDKESIRVELSDNGHGITEENLPHIFEPFFSTKRESSGIGLGLAIVHGIVENHKGTIEVKSEVGSGTKIIITLPLHF